VNSLPTDRQIEKTEKCHSEAGTSECFHMAMVYQVLFAFHGFVSLFSLGLSLKTL